MKITSIISLLLGLIGAAFFYIQLGGTNTIAKDFYVLFGVSNAAFCIFADKYAGKTNWYPHPIFSLMVQAGLSFLVLAIAGN